MNINGHQIITEGNELLINNILILRDTRPSFLRQAAELFAERVEERCEPFKRTLTCHCGEVITFHSYAVWDAAMNMAYIDELCPKCKQVECAARDCSDMVDPDADHGLCIYCHFDLERGQQEHEDRAIACWGCHHDYKQISCEHLLTGILMEDGSKEQMCSNCHHGAAMTGQLAREAAAEILTQEEMNEAYGPDPRFGHSL